MTVEETVKVNILTYPSLFSDRFDVFKHIFIGYGTGYEWIDGELVCTRDEDDSYCNTIEEGVKKAFATHINDKQLLTSSLQFVRDYTLRAVLNVVNWEENSKKFIPKKSMYEIDRYLSLNHSPIFLIPDDVKDDWREASLLMLDWLINESELKNDSMFQKAIELQNRLKCISQ